MPFRHSRGRPFPVTPPPKPTVTAISKCSLLQLTVRYVPRMLGEAWASMKSRYGFVPKVPVQVELYANREQFSVRTSGLPNIGIQGVCFGGMIAAISPNAEPFNWGNVVWHELGHVFAIQLSKNHVPRWFTEGLSEYETIARRPEWARELDPELYRAVTENKLPGAVDMNRAFSDASDANDVTTASDSLPTSERTR